MLIFSLNYPNILLIEDDKDISELISHYLKRENFNVIVAYNGDDALDLLKSKTFNLIILDLMLPNISGIEVLKQIKRNQKTKDIPVVIESAKGEETDIVIGLELGADDYVTKPFSPKVLTARVKRLLERIKGKNSNNGNLFIIGELTLDIERHEVTLNGKPLRLTYIEFSLLKYLVLNKGRVLSRDNILENIWFNEAYVVDRVIDVHINSLRKKLGEASYLIETIRGVGYKLKEE